MDYDPAGAGMDCALKGAGISPDFINIRRLAQMFSKHPVFFSPEPDFRLHFRPGFSLLTMIALRKKNETKTFFEAYKSHILVIHFYNLSQ